MSEQKKASAWGPREIVILASLILFFGFLAIMERPKFVTGSPPSQASICVNNLRRIDAAKQSWVLEHNAKPGNMVTTNDIASFLFPGTLTCPSGGTYTIGKVGEPPTCSIGNTVTPAHVLP
jgi:hypothetical protein